MRLKKYVNPSLISTITSHLRSRLAVRMTICLCSLALLLDLGCVGSRVVSSSAPLAIVSFAASPDTISKGQSTTLVWSVNGAAGLSVSDGSGPVGASVLTPVTANSVSVSPAASTTYTMTATDTLGHTTTASVVVSVVPPPVISSFTATPSLISNAQASTLAWTVSGASTLSIDNGVGLVVGNSISVSPTSTTTYTLTATNPAGVVVTAQTTVTVVLAPIIASFVATPAEIGLNQSSTLSWSVIGATSISLDNGIGVITGNSISVNPAHTTTFTLTATNSQGSFSVSQSAQATVKISAVPPPVISSFTAGVPSLGHGAVALTPVFIPADGTAAASIDQGIGPVLSGVPIDSNPISTSTTFTLTVTNATGTTTATTRVIAGNVAVFAGRPTSAGYADGTGTAARFYQPTGIAADHSGNIYVADANNYVIRKITPLAEVTTFAGTPNVSGSVDGASLLAEFNSPFGVAVDSSGNVYVSDYSTVRVINPSGVVITLAGTSGQTGIVDGTGPAAQFGSLQGIAVDSAQNIYVSDYVYCNIRKITSAGVVTTLAGPTIPGLGGPTTGLCGNKDGQGSAARFQNPAGIAVDASGNVYVADTTNSTIRKITPQGLVTTLAGTAGLLGSADGTGPAAKFRKPTGVAVDISGDVYVADAQNYTVRKITPDGVVTTIVGQAGQVDPQVAPGPLPSRIATPSQIAVDPVSGKLFITMSVHAIATSPF
jgi:hypothetical protein